MALDACSHLRRKPHRDTPNTSVHLPRASLKDLSPVKFARAARSKAGSAVQPVRWVCFSPPPFCSAPPPTPLKLLLGEHGGVGKVSSSSESL